MVKNTIVTLVAAASLAGIAVPAIAAAAPVPAPVVESEGIESVFGGGSPEMRDFIAASVLAQLQQKGVNATAVEDWSGLIRAFVTLDDGSQTMQFYKPGSLEQVLL